MKLIKLKTLIFQSGCSQRTIAMHTSIPEVRLSEIINGKTIPTQEEQRRLAKVLNVEGSKLFPEIIHI